jgi:hypothetical protein
MSTNDAGSGPTKGAKPNTGSTAASDSSGPTENSAFENSAGVTPGPKSTGGSHQPRRQCLRRSSNFEYRRPAAFLGRQSATGL